MKIEIQTPWENSDPLGAIVVLLRTLNFYGPIPCGLNVDSAYGALVDYDSSFYDSSRFDFLSLLSIDVVSVLFPV
jgi:hypothetical protein